MGSRETTNGRLLLVGDSVADDLTQFACDVRTGLTHVPKFLSCRYFYDLAGSLLFEKICELPEYYPTRAEREILTCRAREIDAALPDGCSLIELGSGTSAKTQVLLEAMLATRGRLHYVPVDISRRILQETANLLLHDFAGLRVTAIRGDYQTGIRFARANLDGPRCILFLGSSIGNFDRPDAVAFLATLAEAMSPADTLLVGMDLRKDRRVLERAYDDSQGVTAAFNKNILARINRLFDGDFDLDRFAHRAWFDDDLGRVELHLVSRDDQNVRIEGLDLDVHFAAGESIHTENSYKYGEAEIDALAEEAGLSTRRRWFDGQKRFSLNLFARSRRRAAVDPKQRGTP